MSKVMVEVRKVHKEFKIPYERHTSLKQHLFNIFRNRGYHQFTAIQEVDFDIKEGEFFGIIGQNGSGKSTLLKILAGIYAPTRGEVKIHGKLSPFIELGVGFNPELTARENVYLNGAILGLTRADIAEQFDDIIAFAELEEFVEQKLKNFSSGMLVRLAFSVAIRAHADILLIDEVLAVGDANFQQKCYDVFRQMKGQGKTIIFVSHDLASIKEFSDRVLLLNKGTSYGVFSPNEAIAEYGKLNKARSEKALKEKGKLRAKESSPDPHYTAIELLDENDSPTRVVTLNDPLKLKLSISNPGQAKLVVGVGVYRSDGQYCFATNTALSQIELPTSKKFDVTIYYPTFNLLKGGYYLVVGIFDQRTNETYEMEDHIMDFEVVQTKSYEGIVYIDHKWEVHSK